MLRWSIRNEWATHWSTARILKDNPKAIYIHCHAHQLNLALVDSCRSLPFASDFFSLLESLYVLMSSSVPYNLFLQKQKELKMREVALVKLCYTRWSCRHTSIKAVKNRLTAITSLKIPDFHFYVGRASKALKCRSFTGLKIMRNISIPELLPSLENKKKQSIKSLWIKVLELNSVFSKRPEDLNPNDIDQFNRMPDYGLTIL